ncbi:hypothetical protein [Amycolatopsis sp. YIM 10]|uniref:hypothetical protein n=1 Tax=Amycolatopsis sp. YIM 10 TaxID=2653857 RepID=UPI0012906ED9|nr:hypothetical protein [Amycolatopsis sp. YIM 10]
MWTSEDALKELVSRNFRAIQLAGSPGQPEMMLFSRGWEEPFMDEVIVRGEDDATACRRSLADSVDFLERKDFVWYKDGSVVEVVDELIFHLPHPANPNAPKIVIPTPGTLWLPPGARTEVHS